MDQEEEFVKQKARPLKLSVRGEGKKKRLKNDFVVYRIKKQSVNDKSPRRRRDGGMGKKVYLKK